ncbi:ankyrin repeat domain-containing protein [Leptospira sp. WS92.C1]
MKLILSIFVFFSFPIFLLSQDLSIEDRRFLSAAINGNIRLAKRALKNGASVDAKDPRANHLGETALFKASWNNDVGFVQLLLEHKADVNLADSEGQTALIMAVYGLSVEVVKLLLTKKVDLYAETKSGLSAAIVAADLCSFPILRMLKEAGVDLNRPTQKGYRPLYAASSRCNHKFLEYILESGADVDAVANGGQTALFRAAKFTNRDALLILLDRGASVIRVDEKGYNAFYYVLSIWDDVKLVETFLKAGLRLDQEEPDGNTALSRLLSADLWFAYFKNRNFDLDSKNRFGLSKLEFMNIQKKSYHIRKDTSRVEKEISLFADKDPFAALQVAYILGPLPQFKDLIRKLLLSILSKPKRTDLGALELELWKLGFAVNDPEILKQLYKKYPDPPIGFWFLLPSFQQRYEDIRSAKIPEDSFLLDLWLRSVEKKGFMFGDMFRTPYQLNTNWALEAATYQCRVDLLEKFVKKKNLFNWKYYDSSIFKYFIERNQCRNEKEENRILQLLLQIGADPGKINWIWNSPVCSSIEDMISYQKNKKVLLRLLELGGNPNCLLDRDKYSTALEMVQFFGMEDLVKILRDFGAYDTLSSELKLAISGSDLAKVKELISCGAVVSYKELRFAKDYDAEIFSYLLDSYNALESPLFLNIVLENQDIIWPEKLHVFEQLVQKGFSFKVRSRVQNAWNWMTSISIFKGARDYIGTIRMMINLCVYFTI